MTSKSATPRCTKLIIASVHESEKIEVDVCDRVMIGFVRAKEVSIQLLFGDSLLGQPETLDSWNRDE